MTSFFEVCFALDPKMRTRFPDTTAAQVGQATATHCFMRADVNKGAWLCQCVVVNPVVFQTAESRLTSSRRGVIRTTLLQLLFPNECKKDAFCDS